MTRRGGRRRKSDDWPTGSSRQKGHHALEKFERGSSVWTEVSVRTACGIQPTPGRSLTRKKERKRIWKIENPPKISTTQTVFILQSLSIGKLYVFKKERNCKSSVSLIVKFIEWTLIHASVRRLRYFYSSQRKGKKEKKRKKKKGLLRDIFVWCFPVSLTFCCIFKKKREKKKRTVF